MAGRSYAPITLGDCSFVQGYPLVFEQDFDAVHVFQDLDLLSYEPFGHGVAVGIHMHKPFGVNDPWQWLVYGRDIGRQRQKVRFFHKVGGLRAHTEGALDFCVGHLRTPAKCLKVEIKPVAKGTSCKEISLYIGKKPFNACFSIRIPHTVGHKSGAEDLSEGLHLRGYLGLGTGAVSDKDAGIVNRTPGTGAVHEAECL